MPAKLDTHLRFAYAGGSPLSPTLKAQVEQLLGVPLHNGYGLTETAPTVSQTRLDQPRSDTSVGHAIPGIEVRVETGSDGAGELWVRGPNVMRGYYQEPELTAAVLRDDGWLNTGDIVRQEVDGALFIVGRTKELIIRSGFNVYPLEVETVLNAHPAVTQSAVVGRVAADGNEEVLAYVEPDPHHAVTADELASYLATQLAPYKRPSEIILMAALPAAATGKILKSRLRQASPAPVAAADDAVINPVAAQRLQRTNGGAPPGSMAATKRDMTPPAASDDVHDYLPDQRGRRLRPCLNRATADADVWHTKAISNRQESA
jgi:acyl-CoA synthetase (AMP-forming)/AMP-acid ligase II